MSKLDIKPAYQRLESLDILRGFDLFMLGLFQPLFGALANASEWSWMIAFKQSQFSHVAWEGFAFWDLIMPLFMFMAGVSMPFAFGSYLKGKTSAGVIYRRIFKRVVLLFIFGAMIQGNLFKLDLHSLRIYSNTLQSIGVGYLFTALIIMNIRSIKAQLSISVGLLLLYWLIFTIGGDHTPEGNIAEKIDRLVLGRFRDGVSWDANGHWLFSDGYHYTWILSSINFTVTVMTGYFAGLILKSNKEWKQKLRWLVVGGVAMCLLGYLLNFQHPIIKKVWSSSMTLLSSGYCFLLMALFYYLVDVRGYKRQLGWLKPYGMNSILAYLMFNLLDIGRMLDQFTGGLSQWTGDFHNPLCILLRGLVIYAILYHLYKQNKFLKV